ncbi:MAG: Jag N-terminal domain-containing protein, partial [Actinomycetia bacterium]|nr:Jag N-terminal domain-containing protein [Actinomycetes bacterium]
MDRLKNIMTDDQTSESEKSGSSSPQKHLPSDNSLKKLAQGWDMDDDEELDEDEDIEEEEDDDEALEDEDYDDNGIEVKAKSIEDALDIAVEKLGVSIEYLDYEIIRKGSSGMFGIGKKDFILYITSSKSEYIDELDEIDGISLSGKAAAEPVITHQDAIAKLRIFTSGVYLIIIPPIG